MSYIAYLCYPNPYDDEDEEDREPELKFTEPNNYWQYAKVVPIQFSVLHSWSDKDKGLYK